LQCASRHFCDTESHVYVTCSTHVDAQSPYHSDTMSINPLKSSGASHHHLSPQIKEVIYNVHHYLETHHYPTTLCKSKISQLTTDMTGWGLTSVLKVMSEAKNFPEGQIQWSPPKPMGQPKIDPTDPELQKIGTCV
jgi:hypothetical protein